MTSFSQRHGHSKKNIQYESMDDVLKHRLWNTFYSEAFCAYEKKGTNLLNFGFFNSDFTLSNIEEMMKIMGVVYEHPTDNKIKQKNASNLQKYLLNSDKWYLMYDFIEEYLKILNNEKKKTVIAEFNKVLEEEVSGYRIVNCLVTSIINETELQTIAEATETRYDAVNTHLNKALSLFSNREIPDYENSIKESISAVEALCKIVTQNDSATLGQALKKLDVMGIKLHKAFQDALDKLYGYTSDENGIRHAGVDFKNASPEDAKFMLVSCSAFVNYLIDKWEKTQNQK